MARSLPTTALLAVMTVAVVRTSGAYAARTCDGQTLDKKFENCIDLQHLGAFLHYTYDPSNTSIAVAFIAKPAASSGWVAWGINPVGPAMLGSQTFVAYLVNGVVTIKTYNVSGYSPATVVPTPLSFATWDESVKMFGSSGEIVMYASAKVPVRSQKNLAHVWQVGPSVNGSVLSGHAMTQDNLKSFGTINL